MSVSVDWDSQYQAFIVMQFQPQWQAKDLIVAITHERELASEVDYEPDLLVDLTNVPLTPPQLIVELRRLPYHMITEKREIVIAGVEALQVTFIQNIIYVLFPQLLDRMTFCKDFEDALRHLGGKQVVSI